ncbi:hypothetical protein [Streptomyces roseochromogenus]|uniref:Uncharacterized protein n=1 Tax=Streptomyces roseochromogenus subsp. oscitans DS 12.976 TaxID=1352936 RepID=V6KS99_STRRC|nr:hypothetical protein [Streptomyces roseochromogenus]EST35070.1 hypothetical protein M878_07520 [Streptomyces roseochromogenus subsp. oscitans DS 12.976]
MAGAALAIADSPCLWATVGRSMVVAFGAFSVADVALPMRCAPSLEPGCPADNRLLAHHDQRPGPFRPVRPDDGVHSRGTPRRLAPSAGPALGAPAPAIVHDRGRLFHGPYFGHPGGHGIAQPIHLVTVAV